MPDYIIKAEMPGYETKYVKIPAANVKGRGTAKRNLDVIRHTL